MALAPTSASVRFSKLLTSYLSNPVGERTPAFRIGNMATTRKKTTRKRRTAAQIAATKKMIAANRKKKAASKKTSRKKTARRKTTKKAATRRKTTKKATTSRRRPVRRKKKMAARKRTRRRNPVRRRTTTAIKTNPVRRRRRKTTRRRRRNPALRSNSWSEAKQPTTVRKAPRHRRAAKAGWYYRKHKKAPRGYEVVKRSKRSRRKSLRRRSNPAVGGTLTRTLMGHQSSTNARLANPIKTNPINGNVLTGLAITGAGLGFGLMIANLTDRFVATRTPAPVNGQGGKHPWYGRNATLAYMRRPDAMRLGAQGGGAVLSLMLTGATRKMPLLPFLFAGTTLGFAANLFEKVFSFYILPKVLKVEKTGEESLANRIAPFEQDAVQDRIDELMDNYMQVADLQGNQQETPIIQGPLNTQPVAGAGIVTLGKREGSHPLAETGHVGKCESCGGQGGHYSACPGLTAAACDECPPFPDGQPARSPVPPTNVTFPPIVPSGPSPMIPGSSDPFTPGTPNEGTPFTPGSPGGEGTPFVPADLPPQEALPPGTPLPKCEYRIQRGDDLYAFAQEAGVDINEIAEENGLDPTDWKPGTVVQLPYSMCRLLARRPARTAAPVPADEPSAFVPGMTPGISGVGEEEKEMRARSLGFGLYDED